jgi:replication factor C subunit 2/4
MDEADFMTDFSQNALNGLIEEYDNVSFCFICNHFDKMILPLRSRCSVIQFKPLKKQSVISKLEHIAKIEGFDIEKSLFDTIFELSNGDLRKAISFLQNVCTLFLSNQELLEMSLKPNLNRIESLFFGYGNFALNNLFQNRNEIQT